MSTIRAIEIGYGSLSLTEDVIDGIPTIKTFASIVSPVSNDDLSGGLAKRETVRVEVGKNWYEVGNDAYLLTDRSSSRVLNNTFIETDQYKALFKGALAFMKNVTVIDLLVLSLPVNNMLRSNDLKAMAMGEHTVDGRTITVKSVWVLCQPLAGYLCYANQIGQEGFNVIKEQNVLSLDFGFTTADWLTSRGLKINDKRSNAVNMGMSAVLEAVQHELKSAFPHLDTIPLQLIDEAFWKHPGELKISGRSYPFPICQGKDTKGEVTKVKYDVSGAISKVAESCIQSVRNSVGSGAEISLIVVMGGSYGVYLPEVKKAYPEHEIVIVQEPMTAVCRGMYYGGVQYMAALKRQKAA
ncbi:ParM/StbA family protein [Rheinheimera sp.]|uniref:ParM/StbA family protein n=1 Tax=Rheinheimera sp. TaxID=1869214 RepID=UPI0040486B14